MRGLKSLCDNYFDSCTRVSSLDGSAVQACSSGLSGFCPFFWQCLPHTRQHNSSCCLRLLPPESNAKKHWLNIFDCITVFFPLSSISLQLSKVLFVAASMTTIPLLCNMASQGKPAFRTLVFNMPAFHWLLNAVLFYVAQEIGANEKELHSGLEIQWDVEMIEMIEMIER